MGGMNFKCTDLCEINGAGCFQLFSEESQEPAPEEAAFEVRVIDRERISQDLRGNIPGSQSFGAILERLVDFRLLVCSAGCAHVVAVRLTLYEGDLLECSAQTQD